MLERGTIGGRDSGLAVCIFRKARNVEGISQFSELMGKER